MTPDVYDLMHWAKKMKYESREKGERNDLAIALLGGCSIFLGATMLMKCIGRGR